MSLYQQQSKENTLRQIFRYLKKYKTFTSLEMSRELKKTLPTINTNLKYLQNQKYVSIDGEHTGFVGRPAISWRSNVLQLESLVLEVQIDAFVIAHMSLDGNIFRSEKYTVDGREDLLAIYQEKIQHFLDKYNLYFETIGISVPGIINFSRKKLLYSANMTIRDLDFRILESKLGMTVIIENNANAAVLGELFLSQSENIEDMIFISITNQGVGGGQIVEQKLQKGTTRRGGKIGHMSIDLYGIPCTCGRKGCLERYISELGFLSIAKQYGVENKKIDEICTNLNSNHMRIIREYVWYFGKGLQNLICILDPCLIIIGGFVSQYWNLFYPLLKEEIFLNNNLISQTGGVELRPATFNNYASLYGAALLPHLSLFYEDSTYI